MFSKHGPRPVSENNFLSYYRVQVFRFPLDMVAVVVCSTCCYFCCNFLFRELAHVFELFFSTQQVVVVVVVAKGVFIRGH